MTPTTTDLQKLLAEATRGPWRVGKTLCGFYPAIVKDFHVGHNMNVTGAIHGYMYHADQKANQQANARLIAMAPTLAARVIELEAENKRLREGLESELADTEAEDALTSEGIGTWGPDGERFERMFAVVMKARAALEDKP